MKLGIIGLPQSGKTTIFEALTKSISGSSHKGEERISTIRVPDGRIDTFVFQIGNEFTDGFPGNEFRAQDLLGGQVLLNRTLLCAHPFSSQVGQGGDGLGVLRPDQHILNGLVVHV